MSYKVSIVSTCSLYLLPFEVFCYLCMLPGCEEIQTHSQQWLKMRPPPFAFQKRRPLHHELLLWVHTCTTKWSTCIDTQIIYTYKVCRTCKQFITSNVNWFSVVSRRTTLERTISEDNIDCFLPEQTRSFKNSQLIYYHSILQLVIYWR